MRTHPLLSLLLVGALVVLVTESALGGQTTYTNVTPQLKLNWPFDPGGSGVFGNSVLADLDADGLEDFVTIRGGVVEALCGPSVYAARLTNIATATDVAPLRRKRPAPDSLIVTGPLGLRQLTWDPVALTWLREDLSTETAWTNARRILVRPISKDVPPQIVGLDEDGLGVRVLYWNGMDYAETEIFASPVELRELVLYDREGDGPTELAVMADEYLAVFEVAAQDPTGLETWVTNESYFFPGFKSVDITAGRDDCSPAEWVAWVADGPGLTTQWMATISALGSSAPVNLQGNRGIVALASGDWNGDCNTDVLLSWTESEQVPILANRGSTAPAPFSIRAEDGSVQYLDAGDPSLAAPTNQAAPVSGDLDGDGDEDLCFPVQSQASLYVALNSHVNHGALKPRLEDPNAGGGTGDPGGVTPGGAALTALEATDVRLRPRVDTEGAQIGEDLAFTLYSEPAEIPTLATHIEVLLWRMPDTSSHTDPVAVDQELIRLDGSTEFTVELELVDGDVYPMQPIYFWMQRYVSVDTTTGVITVFPAQVHGIQANGFSSPQWTWMTRPVLMGSGEFELTRDVTVSSSTTEALVNVPETLGRGLAFPCLPELPNNRPPGRP